MLQGIRRADGNGRRAGEGTGGLDTRDGRSYLTRSTQAGYWVMISGINLDAT